MKSKDDDLVVESLPMIGVRGEDSIELLESLLVAAKLLVADAEIRSCARILRVCLQMLEIGSPGFEPFAFVVEPIRALQRGLGRGIRLVRLLPGGYGGAIQARTRKRSAARLIGAPFSQRLARPVHEVGHGRLGTEAAHELGDLAAMVPGVAEELGEDVLDRVPKAGAVQGR